MARSGWGPAMSVAGCVAALVLSACGRSDEGYVAPPRIGEADRLPAQLAPANPVERVPPSPTWQVAPDPAKTQSPAATSPAVKPGPDLPGELRSGNLIDR